MTTSKGNRLGNEQVLNINDYLESANKIYQLLLHESGCLELFCTKNNQIFWHSNTFSKDIDAVRMQYDGNLVIYKKGGTNAAWATGTNKKNGDYLELQDDGNLVLYKKDGSPVWSTDTYGQIANMLMHLNGAVKFEQTIKKNEYLISANGKYKLLLQEDGDLILFETKTKTVTWSSNTKGIGVTELRMQDDGNLVLYKGIKKDPVWATGTNGKGNGSRLLLENYGHLVLYSDDGHITWTSHDVDTSNWMAKLNDSLSLKQICIPGSHDAGMYFAEILSTKDDANFAHDVATYFGKGIAQTQNKNIYEQLKAGVRYFDIRPQLYKSEFYLYHGPAFGPSLKAVLADINKFREEAKEETIILNFSHFKEFNNTIDKLFIDELARSFKTEYLFDVEKHKNASGILNYNHLFDFPLSDLRGKIILLIEDNRDMYNNEVLAKNRKGIYYLLKGNNINADPIYSVKIFDEYADKEVCHEMVENQKNKFNDFKNSKELFLLNWTLTTNEKALIDDIRAVTGTKGNVGIGINAAMFILNPGAYIIGKVVNLPAVKAVIDKHSVETFARGANHTLLGNRLQNDFVFAPNKHGKMVNIINTDYVEWVNGVRACLRVMNP